MTTSGRQPRAWLSGLLRAALLLIGISPFLPRLLTGIPLFGHLGDAIDAWFAFQCHREPDRSLRLLEASLPVCSRCFGIYVGLGLGAAILRPRLAAGPIRIWVGAAALVMILDVLTETLTMRPPSTALRAFTGILLAYPVAVAVVRAAQGPEPQAA